MELDELEKKYEETSAAKTTRPCCTVAQETGADDYANWEDYMQWGMAGAVDRDFYGFPRKRWQPDL